VAEVTYNLTMDNTQQTPTPPSTHPNPLLPGHTYKVRGRVDGLTTLLDVDFNVELDVLVSVDFDGGIRSHN
jgi:hypothetical protein